MEINSITGGASLIFVSRNPEKHVVKHYFHHNCRILMAVHAAETSVDPAVGRSLTLYIKIAEISLNGR